MDEQEFIETIDCQFPYDDGGKAEALTKQALAISPNAAFMILHEVVHAPSNVSADAPGRTAALRRLEHSFRHPLAAPLLPVAKRVLRGEHLTPPETIDKLQRIAPFPGQYNALAIVYLSCKQRHQAAHETYTSIVSQWRAAGHPEDAS